MKALEAAKLACERSGWKLTNLQLQKILYIAHMIYAGREDSKPLIEDDLFEAWDYGPVLPSLYHHVSAFGARPVGNVFHRVSADAAKLEQRAVIEEAVDHFAKASPFTLVEIVHEPEGAWYQYYEPGRRHIRIPQSAIAEEYRRRFSEEGVAA